MFGDWMQKMRIKSPIGCYQEENGRACDSCDYYFDFNEPANIFAVISYNGREIFYVLVKILSDCCQICESNRSSGSVFYEPLPKMSEPEISAGFLLKKIIERTIFNEEDQISFYNEINPKMTKLLRRCLAI